MSLAGIGCLALGGSDEFVAWGAMHARQCRRLLFCDAFAPAAFPALLEHVPQLATADVAVCCEAMCNSLAVVPRENADQLLPHAVFVALLLMAAEEDGGKPILSFLELVCRVPEMSSLYASGDREAFLASYSHMILSLKSDRAALIREMVEQVRNCEEGSLRRWIGIEALRLLDPTVEHFGPPEKAPNVPVDVEGVPEESVEAFAHLL